MTSLNKLWVTIHEVMLLLMFWVLSIPFIWLIGAIALVGWTIIVVVFTIVEIYLVIEASLAGDKDE